MFNDLNFAMHNFVIDRYIEANGKFGQQGVKLQMG